MSKAMNSPTARLLQSSRLFSLPRPLPQPTVELATATGVYRNSDTKTLPYPTHQAIATPSSSHFRGDWGLKRPLPRRVTQETSTPHLRIKAQDTVDHITDFESASDHTRTEAKWQQMGIPMITRETRTTITNEHTPKSVYDEDVDNTVPQVANVTSLPTSRSRSRTRSQASMSQVKTKWKYDGPWIAGMDEGEFEDYLKHKISNRVEEFREFLLERMFREHVNKKRSDARAQGQTLSEGAVKKLRTDYAVQFEDEAKNLRFDHMQKQLSSEMTAAICDFLDLPSVRPSRPEDLDSTAFNLLANMNDSGPMTTHPGAGLSHIRTNLFMENHPLYGPQASRSPVLARVVRPRAGHNINEHAAKLGVGGVVTNDPVQSAFDHRRGRSASSFNESEEERYLNAESMVHTVDADLRRGNHIYVQTGNAFLDDSGRIRLDVSRGEKEAIAVKRNDVGPIHSARIANVRPPIPNMAPPGTSGNANYGAGLPDMRNSRPRQSKVQGFDKELGTLSPQDKSYESDATAKIRSLLGGRNRSTKQ